jgi:anti-sigma-K factor RskA
MNEHVDELLALYALGGLEAEELKTVVDHLAVCAVCRAEAQRQTALVAALAASVPPRAPDPRLRAQLLSKLNIATPVRAPLQPRPAAAPARSPRRPLNLSRWLTGAFAVLAAALVGWNVYLTGQVVNLQHSVQYNQNALALIAGADTAHMPLVGQGAFASAGGNAYIDHKTQDVVLVVQQLKPLAADQTYQAWIIGSQGPVSAGLFRVSDAGWGMTWLNTPYVQGGVIGVSLEPKDGSPKPTQVVLLTAQ